MFISGTQSVCRPLLGPVLAAGAFHLIATFLYLIPFQSDVSALMCLAEPLKDRPPFERIRAGFRPLGYDGAYYYAIAQDPWSKHDNVVDLPCYRHVRILYPALAWMFSGGDAERLLWVMPAINCAAVMGLAWLGTLLAVHYRRSRWWGLLLPIALNSTMPSFRNLTDPLAAVTVIGLLTAWLLEWPTWLLIGWGTASVLSREQNIALVMILLLEALLARRWSRMAGLGLISMIWAAWLLALKQAYGVWPTLAVNVGPPFEGLWYHWTHLEGRPGPLTLPVHALRVALTASVLAVGLCVIARGERVARLIAITALGLWSISSDAIFRDSFAYSRVLNLMPLAIWLWSVQAGRRWPAVVLASAGLWPAMEIVRVWR